MTSKRFFLREGLSLAFVVALAALLRTSVFGIYHVPTQAMRPTLLPGDSILVDRLAFGLTVPFFNARALRWREPQRGEVVVFRDPSGNENVLVKRVAAVGGDKVAVRAGRLSINGAPLEEVLLTDTQLYQRHEVSPEQVRLARERSGSGQDHLVQHPVAARPDAFEARDFVVPPGQLFCLGDNRADTFEVRFWGFIDTSLVLGKVRRVAYSVPTDPSPGTAGPRWWRTGQAVR